MGQTQRGDHADRERPAGGKVDYTAPGNGFPSRRDHRRPPQRWVFYFIATYQLGDRNAQEECRQTMTTILIES